MKFPGTVDYTLGFGTSGVVGTAQIVSDWVDTEGHAREVDAVLFVCSTPIERTLTLFQNSLSQDTGSSEITLPSDFSSNSVEGTYKFRLPASDTAGEWYGPVNGRYLKMVLTKAGLCTGQSLIMVHRSSDYPIE